MGSIFRSFRFNMLLLFCCSLLFAAVITFGIYRAAQLYYYTTDINDATTRIRWFIREVGDVNFFLLFFVPLSIVFFLMLTKRYARYFQEISGGINQLASGNFDTKIDVSSSDEFGDIARDINKAGEKLRSALQRGDFAESSKEQLVLNLAHDLRTPLTSVIGYLDYILKNEELEVSQAKHYTSIAYTKSLRLERLIDELFEVTRMNYGKLNIDRKLVDVGELLLQVNEELYPLLEKMNLTARLYVNAGSHAWGDGELLARVFENLLSNAAQYGTEGEYIDIHCQSEEDQVLVSIVNYGNRIPAEDLPQIFDMFFTGDKARTYHEGSTGLGLFIAKNIVEQHGGTITADSDEIRTSFDVRLPCRKPDPKEQSS